MTSYRSTSAFRVKGFFYRAGSSVRYDAQLSYLISSDTISIEFDGMNEEFSYGAYSIVPGVGKASRTVEFADGALFETDDYKSFNTLESITGKHRHWHFLRRIESHLVFGFVSIVLVAIFIFSIYQFGLPAFAKVVAHEIPDSVYEKAEKQSLEMLDKDFLKKSHLTQTSMNSINIMINKMSSLSPDYQMKVYFRDGGVIGPNAFALPAGGVVVTDQMVDLATPLELEAVLAHEAGHVYYRHSMQILVYNSVLAVISAYVVGDVVSLGTAISTVPLIIIQNGYSRKAEREADAYAGRYMLKKYNSTEPLVSVLQKLEEKIKGGGIPGWLSTHPETEDRIKALRAMKLNNN